MLPVLPDNVGGFRSTLDVDFEFAHPSPEMRQLRISVGYVIELQCTIHSFLALEGHEDGAWGRESLDFTTFEGINLSINFIHLVPVLTLNAVTPLAEKFNCTSVAIGESRDGNLDMLDRLVLEAKIRQLRQAILHLLREPVSEGIRSRIVSLSLCAVLLLKEFFTFLVEPVLEELGIDVKLDGVVGRRDSLHVPLNVVVLLGLPDVVEVVDDEESEEDGYAGHHQAQLSPPNKLFTRNFAAYLNKD